MLDGDIGYINKLTMKTASPVTVNHSTYVSAGWFLYHYLTNKSDYNIGLIAINNSLYNYHKYMKNNAFVKQGCLFCFCFIILIETANHCEI